jgi:hypothetical protein
MNALLKLWFCSCNASALEIDAYPGKMSAYGQVYWRSIYFSNSEFSSNIVTTLGSLFWFGDVGKVVADGVAGDSIEGVARFGELGRGDAMLVEEPWGGLLSASVEARGEDA